MVTSFGVEKMGLVIGTGPTLTSDLQLWEKSGLKELLPVDIIAVNRAGFIYLEPINAWASHHPLEMTGWFIERRKAGGNSDFDVYASRKTPIVEYVLPHEEPTGSSSLLAVNVAFSRGCLGVVVLGCPLNTEDYKIYQEGWLYRKTYLAPRVRAYSGFIREMFGCPTVEWFRGR